MERTYIHVRAAFRLGYGGLVDSENFGKMHLGHVEPLAEFVQSHAGAIFGCQTMGRSWAAGDIFARSEWKFLGTVVLLVGVDDPVVLLKVVAYLGRFRSSCFRC